MLKCYPVIKGERFVHAVDTLVEATTYHVHVQADDVHFNHVPLNRIGDTDFWELRTPFAVGEADFTIKRDGTLHHYSIDVKPNPDKIEDQELWESMLIDLLEWTETLLGHQGVRDGSVQVGELQHYLLLEALHPLMFRFEQALTHLFEHLRERTITPDTALSLLELRAPFPLGQISTNPAAVSWLRGAGSANEVPIVDAPFVQQTFDHPVNRYVRWLVEQVLDRLQDASYHLRKVKQDSKSHSSEYQWRFTRASVLDEMAERLQNRIWGSPLMDIHPSPLKDAAFLVILNDPLYATVHKYGRLLCNQSLDFTGGEFATSMSRTFDIYELWCYQEVVRQFTQVLNVQPTYMNGQTNEKQQPHWGTVAEFTNGESTWKIEYNAHFPSQPPRSPLQTPLNKRHSLLGDLRPDIVVYHSNHKTHVYKWLVLDAKYRTSKINLFDAFSSAFTYNQALIEPYFGGHSVGSYLLTPKSLPKTQRWYGDEYALAYPFGAFECRPNRGTGIKTALALFIVETLTTHI